MNLPPHAQNTIRYPLIINEPLEQQYFLELFNTLDNLSLDGIIKWDTEKLRHWRDSQQRARIEKRVENCSGNETVANSASVSCVGCSTTVAAAASKQQTTEISVAHIATVEEQPKDQPQTTPNISTNPASRATVPPPDTTVHKPHTASALTPTPTVPSSSETSNQVSNSTTKRTSPAKEMATKDQPRPTQNPITSSPVASNAGSAKTQTNTPVNPTPSAAAQTTLQTKKRKQKRIFTKEEDDLILVATKKYTDNNEKIAWREVTKIVGSRSMASIKQRYSLYLDPNVNQGPWEVKENRKVWQLYEKFGKRWTLIATKLGTSRSNMAVKTRIQKLQRHPPTPGSDTESDDEPSLNNQPSKDILENSTLKTEQNESTKKIVSTGKRILSAFRESSSDDEGDRQEKNQESTGAHNPVSRSLSPQVTIHPSYDYISDPRTLAHKSMDTLDSIFDTDSDSSSESLARKRRSPVRESQRLKTKAHTPTKPAVAALKEINQASQNPQKDQRTQDGDGKITSEIQRAQQEQNETKKSRVKTKRTACKKRDAPSAGIALFPPPTLPDQEPHFEAHPEPPQQARPTDRKIILRMRPQPQDLCGSFSPQVSKHSEHRRKRAAENCDHLQSTTFPTSVSRKPIEVLISGRKTKKRRILDD